MTTYNTGNPIGSTDARDRLDNSENMDILENSVTLNEHPDRLGVMRKTRRGMELEHDNQISAHEIEHDAQISAHESEHDAQISAHESEHDAQISAHESEHDAQISAHESEHDAQISAHESEFNIKMAGMAFSMVGTFAAGYTLTDARQTLLYATDGHEYGWTGAFPKVVPPASTPSGTGGVGAGAWVDRSDIMLRTQLSNNWADDENLGINITDDPLLPGSGDNRIKWERSRASLRAGVRDTIPLDDPMSHYRGLIDKNTWDDPAYHGVGSLSFGRNGAAYAYLSTTLGHDCVSYGVVGLAGGAGSCTGNPDIPGDGANYGYCSIGWGKYSQALGRISYAFGEECISGSPNSVAVGWKAKTGPCVAGMPNPIGAGPTLSEGRAATALGHYVEAYGDGATAIGHYIKCYSGAMVFGYGLNAASPIVNAIPGAVGLAANSNVMGVQVTPAPGTSDGFSRIGFNTTYPEQRIEALLKHTDTVSFRLEEGEESANLALKRTVGGAIYDVVSLNFNNSGVGAILINGEQVISNRALAIANNLTIENKVQAILETLRHHGLIAS